MNINAYPPSGGGISSSVRSPNPTIHDRSKSASSGSAQTRTRSTSESGRASPLACEPTSATVAISSRRKANRRPCRPWPCRRLRHSLCKLLLQGVVCRDALSILDLPGQPHREILVTQLEGTLFGTSEAGHVSLSPRGLALRRLTPRGNPLPRPPRPSVSVFLQYEPIFTWRKWHLVPES